MAVSTVENCNFANIIFPQLKVLQPTLIIDKSNSSSDEICLRLLLEEKDTKPFLEEFSRISNTEWINYKKTTNPKKYTYRQTWICHHSNHRKRKSGTARNANCTAKFDVLIKKVNADTVKNDPFLKENEPLTGKIIISLCHTHNITSAEALRMLRVNNEIKQQFFEYFGNGMTAAEASHFHETKFLLEEDYISLANASVNPTHRQVSYLYDCWREMNLGPLINPFEKLQEKIPFYESFGKTYVNELPTEEVKGDLNEVVREISRINDLVKNEIAHNSNVSQNDVPRILNNLRQIKSFSDLKNLCILKALKINRKKIRVQPITISRRRTGMVKCSSRIPSGRQDV